jgi:hypothetical protein
MVNIIKEKLGPNSDFASMYAALDSVHMKSLRDFVHTNVVHKSGQVPRRKAELIQMIVSAVKEEYTHQSRTCPRLPVHTERYLPYATSDCQMARNNLRNYRCSSQKCKNKMNTYNKQVDRQMVNLRKLQYCSLKNVCNCPESVQAQKTVEESGRICYNINKYVTEKKQKPLYRLKTMFGV